MANDMIRMSGMNSGLDTESIINALTANTKLKATKQERNVLKYEATQEAYRDIISKMQNIKNKYFDILNKDSYLAGASIWNKYSSKVLDSNNLETLASGISVTTTINSNPGEYKVAVNKTAKQAKLKGTPISGNAKVDFSKLENNKEYGMTVTVGDTEKTIKFTAGSSVEETRGRMNQALEDAFGESNDSQGLKGNEGMVYVASDGTLVSRAAKGITMSGIGTMSGTNTIDLSSEDLKAGTNTVTFQVGSKTVSTSFQTLNATYFDEAVSDGIIDAANGKTRDGDDLINYLKTQDPSLSDEDAQAKSIELMMKHSETVSLYNQVVDDYKESVRYESFKTWLSGDANVEDENGKTGLDKLYENAEADHRDSIISGWIEKDDKLSGVKDAYDTYVQSEKDSGKTDDEIESLYEYTLRNRNSTYATDDEVNDYSEIRNAFDALVAKYDGTTETDDQLHEAYAKSVITADEAANAAYNTFKAQEGNENVGYYEWATTTDSGAAYAESVNVSTEAYTNWKNDHIESESWHLNRSSWESSESSKFSAYKKFNFKDSTADFGIHSTENVIDHFNESALKNSIGKLELDDGTKFEVNYDTTTNKATVKAYTEDTDGTKNYVQASMTIGKNSANSAETLGNTGSGESTSISQITNSTKLSDIGAKADENGNYNFKINDVSFTFDGNTTVNDMMKKINASTAGVKMTYSSLDNAFTVTSNKYGLAGEINVEDTDGGNLMDLLNLSDGEFTHGENLEVYINGTLYESETNSIEVDGSTFTISNLAKEPKEGEDPVEYTVSIGKDTSAIKDLIKDFVKDYNQLIEDVYKYLDEKPEKDYYFLTDSDKEDLDLTEKQEEKWEEKSKKGLLYHDSITSTIMTGLRTSLMGTVEGLDGNIFSLSSMGLKTVTDYNKHGMFAAIDEDKLDLAIENHLDDIQKLFSDSENGIMKKFSSSLDLGIGTTGKDKGTLIRKAGLATGSTSKDNEIYNAIKRTKTKVDSLNKRYENEQNRLWKRYSNMESLLGTMNSQQASFMSYFQQ